MADELQKKTRLLQVLNRTINDHATNSNLANNLTGWSASAVGGQHDDDDDDDFNASDYGDTSDLGYGSDGGAELRKRSETDFEPDLPSQVDVSFGVAFREGENLVPPPQHGLTVSAGGSHSYYFAMAFIDCSFDGTGMTTFAKCQLSEVTFEHCTFKGRNQFVNIIASGLRYSHCTFENHLETDFEHATDSEFVNRAFDDPWPNRSAIQCEVGQKSELVKKHERELELLSKDPRLPSHIHTQDTNGKWASPGRGLVVKEDREHEFYRDVYFIDCGFDPDKPTVFDNCVLDGVTFRKCFFSGSLFKNFYAKGLEATDCVFDDCKYVNWQRADGEEIQGRTLRGSRQTGDSIPLVMVKQLRKQLYEKPWGLEGIDESEESDDDDKATKSIKVEEDGPAVSSQEEYQPPGGPLDGWDVAAMGKGKGRAAAPGDESK